VATDFYPWSFSRTALDQGSENGGTCCVRTSGKQAKVNSSIAAPMRASVGEAEAMELFRKALSAALRGSGKVILVLSLPDLFQLLRAKDRGSEPSDLLIDK
jgi:hypothetical protein